LIIKHLCSHYLVYHLLLLYCSHHCTVWACLPSPQKVNPNDTSLNGHFRSTLTFIYKEGDIEVEVPFTNDGEAYINATEVYQKFGKANQTFDSWKKRTLIPYAELLIKKGKIVNPQIEGSLDSQTVTLDDVIISKRGNAIQHEQGTWFHPKLAIVFATQLYETERWLSPEFDVPKLET